MRDTGLRTVTGGEFSRKRISSANHALVALLLAPKLLSPGKYHVTTVGILPNKRSQLARYCLVWGIHLVYGPTTIGQVMVKSYFTGPTSPSQAFETPECFLQPKKYNYLL